MSDLFNKIFRIDRRESLKKRSHRSSRTLGCERLEERITLSTSTAAVPEIGIGTISPNEGGFIAFDVVSRVNFDANFFLGLDDDGELILSGTSGGNTNGLFGDWQYLNLAQDIGFSSGDVSSDEDRFATIPPPDPTGKTQPAGGTIALAEIIVSNLNSRFVPTATKSIASRPLGDQNYRAAEIPANSKALPAAQGREIAFEVAFYQPTRSSSYVAKRTEDLLALPIVQATVLPQEDVVPQESRKAVQLVAKFSLPDQAETSGRIANDLSLASEAIDFQFVYSDDNPTDSTQSLDSPFPVDAGKLPSPHHAATAFDQVFADWHDRRTQVAQIREQDHHFFAWEVAAALAFGGLVVRCQHAPARSEIEQEPPRRKKSGTLKDLA